jgi:large subunit ribosomal protein L15
VKLHDLRPAAGSRKAKRRVGRGIASGQGKTAGRGTKGQKARAGGSIPAWFEGGQTPLHQRLPKLHGFKNPFKVDYEVVNLGSIAALIEVGALETGEMPGVKKSKAAASAPVTVNQEILRAAGLVRTLDKPLKVLGDGELTTALFVVADKFSASARSKIEAAGGTVSVLEVPESKKPALKGRAAVAATEVAPAAEAAETPVEGAAEPAATDAPPEAVATEAPTEAPAPAKEPAAKAAATKPAATKVASPAKAPTAEKKPAAAKKPTVAAKAPTAEKKPAAKKPTVAAKAPTPEKPATKARAAKKPAAADKA